MSSAPLLYYILHVAYATSVCLCFMCTVWCLPALSFLCESCDWYKNKFHSFVGESFSGNIQSILDLNIYIRISVGYSLLVSRSICSHSANHRRLVYVVISIFYIYNIQIHALLESLFCSLSNCVQNHSSIIQVVLSLHFEFISLVGVRFLRSLSFNVSDTHPLCGLEFNAFAFIREYSIRCSLWYSSRLSPSLGQQKSFQNLPENSPMPTSFEPAQLLPM